MESLKVFFLFSLAELLADIFVCGAPKLPRAQDVGDIGQGKLAYIIFMI